MGMVPSSSISRIASRYSSVVSCHSATKVLPIAKTPLYPCDRRVPMASTDEWVGVGEERGDGLDEPGGVAAVDDPVIGRQRDRERGRGDHGVAVDDRPDAD